MRSPSINMAMALNRTIYIDNSIPKNAFFSLKQVTSGYSGNIITVFNGISEKTFSYVNGLFINDFNNFIDAGDGTRDLMKWWNHNGTGFFSPVLSSVLEAPKIHSETDGSLSVEFNGNSWLQYSEDNVFFGNNLSLVGMITSGKFNSYIGSIVGSPYAFMSLTSNSGPTTSMNFEGFYNSHNPQVNTRGGLRNTMLNNYQLITYKDCNLETLSHTVLGGHPKGSSNTGLFNLNGRIKEVMSYSTKNEQEQEDFINEAIQRNNL